MSDNDEGIGERVCNIDRAYCPEEWLSNVEYKAFVFRKLLPAPGAEVVQTVGTTAVL